MTTKVTGMTPRKVRTLPLGEKLNDGGLQFYVTDEHDEEVLATFGYHKDAEAFAKLPELVEALRECVTSLDIVRAELLEQEDAVPDWPEIAKGRALLAAIEGGSNG